MMRKITAADLAKVFAIEFVGQSTPWSKETFEHCLMVGYETLLIESNQEIAGFIIMSFEVGEAHILNLCVHPAFQHRGLGAQLLQEMLNKASANGAQVVYLEVRRSNHKAISLYQKYGFQQIAERKRYYPGVPDREDALVLGLSLK